MHLSKVGRASLAAFESSNVILKIKLHGYATLKFSYSYIYILVGRDAKPNKNILQYRTYFFASNQHKNAAAEQRSRNLFKSEPIL